MALFAIAIPILPGKTDAWLAMTDQLKGPRKSEFEAARRRLGVRERSFLQHSPMGDLVVVTLEGDDPAGAFARIGDGDDEFTLWFNQQVADIHGVADPGAPSPDPLPELVSDSDPG